MARVAQQQQPPRRHVAVCLLVCEGEACWAQTSQNQYSATPASIMFSFIIIFFLFFFRVIGTHHSACL